MEADFRNARSAYRDDRSRRDASKSIGSAPGDYGYDRNEGRLKRARLAPICRFWKANKPCRDNPCGFRHYREEPKKSTKLSFEHGETNAEVRDRLGLGS